ncbi:hypothetical protein OAD01_01440 [Candidatus Marinimicrobia bacterium]|nr:hypothetical protein [Candidatus Neomarinimicrobiota bacterium]
MSYHVWWPGQGNDPMYLANTNMNQVRNNYYQNNYTPHMFTNGKDSGSNTATWKNDPKDFINNIALHDIKISGTQSDNAIDFSITSSSVKNSKQSEDIRLFVATVMDKVNFPNSSNGLTDHRYSVIELLLTNAGKKISFINGVDFIETFNWSIPERWLKHSLLTFNNKDLSVIAWIQDYKSKEILQVTEFNFD